MTGIKRSCPECGSEEIYYSPGISTNWMQPVQAANHVLISQGFAPRPASVDTYVCADCGYVRSFISKRADLERIIANWTPLNK
jgi:predicted RNA-binding Zn-ribbon protein involved in translation (DUF1610 family)